MAVKKIRCDFSGFFAMERFSVFGVDLVPAGHGRMLSIKGSGCQVGCAYFCNDLK
ncbi:MAG: hypothetical protein JRI51_12895 [Deltaproteobacteria bacterium]|nr:hypothetical protein [Deltaproteobacteria bacterium]